MATRINKYLSEVGYCSRREADRLILEGKVTINALLIQLIFVFNPIKFKINKR